MTYYDRKDVLFSINGVLLHLIGVGVLIYTWSIVMPEYYAINLEESTECISAKLMIVHAWIQTGAYGIIVLLIVIGLFARFVSGALLVLCPFTLYSLKRRIGRPR